MQLCSQSICLITCAISGLLGCAGGGSEGKINADDEPTVTIAANPRTVVSGGQATLTWSASNASSCIASGMWTGHKSVSGTETINSITQDSTFVLTCDGSSSLSVSVSVTVLPSSNGNLRGEVDSSLISRDGSNQVYVFNGWVTPDDRDGDNGDPVAIATVNQINGTCRWGYEISLEPGDYTLAFTNQAIRDDPQQDDVLVFYATKQVTSSMLTDPQDYQAKNTIRVGPGRKYTTPSAVASIAKEGDIIEIDAGLYRDDIAVWRQNNLVFRGIGGRAHLQATRTIPYTPGDDQQNGKGIWVLRGDDITVENIEFSGAKVTDENGAGIRAEGRNLTICNSYFHDNENGILGGAGHMLIEYSEFNHNGLGDFGRTHNVYVDNGEKLTFRYNYSHHATIGHNLKTRAHENFILYNRIMDETDGNSSYVIDIPEGGLTYIIGNLLQQSPQTDNMSIINYGTEGLGAKRTHHLYLANNTIVNDRGSGTFIQTQPGTALVKAINNIFAGGGVPVTGSTAQLIANLETNDPNFVDRSGFNYRLVAGSSARDSGSEPGFGDGTNLTPIYQYRHRAGQERRLIDGTIDIGAYEYLP